MGTTGERLNRSPILPLTDRAVPEHPHEPNVPSILDSDGRCLVCMIHHAAGELAREVARRRPAALRQVGWLDCSATEPRHVVPMAVAVTDDDRWQPVYVIDERVDSGDDR